MIRNAAILPILSLAALLGGCGGNGNADNAYVDTLSGAGASFPVPVYEVWRFTWGEENGVTINYNSVGSGAGVQQIKDRVVDFGASDAPLKAEELAEAGLVQWPMLIGAVVPVVNIEGVEPGQLRLSGEVLADIFLGKVTTWSDPAVTSLNPDLSLPDAQINVVHRSDSSGTTWIFTSYLSKVSSEWEQGPGWGKDPEWPTGIGAPQNPGVANQVEQNANSIGYVQSDFAIERGLPHVKLRNVAGEFVDPTEANIQAAAANADWANAPGMYMVLTNQPGADSWPIAGATYLLVHKDQGDLAKIETLLSWLDWCYVSGDDLALQQKFIPMPENVSDMVRSLWSTSITHQGAPVWPIVTESVAAVE